MEIFVAFLHSYGLSILTFGFGGLIATLLLWPKLIRKSTELENLEQRLTDQQKFTEQFEERTEEVFKSISSQALRENNKAFLDIAKNSLEHLQQSAKQELKHRQEAIGTLVKPLQDSLHKVQNQVQQIEKAREGAYQGLMTQVKSLSETQGKLKDETAQLVQSLRTPSVRGRWGEVQLKRVVELAGMVERCDFSTQTTVGSGEGITRPDLTVHLPGDKQVVVDAKTPIEAYLEAVQATSDKEREQQLARHVRHIKTHIAQLGGKAYWKQFERTPEFVILFLPGECFFSAAIERDPSLIEYGMNHQVVVATPTTLIALLRSIAYGWDQQKLTEHAREIRKLGRELFDRISGFGGHMETLRRGLMRSVDGYNKAVGSLESRVLVSARRLGDLVSKESDQLDSIEPIESLPRNIEFTPLEGESGQKVEKIVNDQ